MIMRTFAVLTNFRGTSTKARSLYNGHFLCLLLSDIGDCHCVNFDRTLVRIEVCKQRNTAVAFLCHNVHLKCLHYERFSF